MTASLVTVPSRSRALARTLWTTQILLGVFFIVASAGPKLFGEAYAVQIFTDIGAGQWFRYAIGVIELAGGIGLLVPRLAGLAALGLVGLMIGATITQVVILDAPVMASTPVVLGVVFALIAWARRAEIRDLVRLS
jgi:putative oxidoreductase